MKKILEVPDIVRAEIKALPDSEKVEFVEGYNPKSEEERRERSYVIDYDKTTVWMIYGMPGSADEKPRERNSMDLWHLCFRRDCDEPLIVHYGVMLCSNCMLGGLEFFPNHAQKQLHAEGKKFIPTGEQFVEAAQFRLDIVRKKV